MAQWTDDVITAPHPNALATAMSIDLSGNLALLGSRRNLTLVDLNKPKEVLRRISLNNHWDISKLSWNSSVLNQQYFLTTYNQWTDLWHCNQANGTCVATFEGHTRAISDVDWSGVDPNLFATCSLDQYIYLWDIRETKHAKLVKSTVSGASHIRWSKFEEYVFASSHGGNIHIWDIRNNKTPVQYITAHVSKINYLDWSPTTKQELASASHDTTISFWNTSEKPRVAEFQIHVQSPVWRAEYTPFGTAVASLALRNFRETPFSLWNINDSSQPVHVFDGHPDVVLDFEWRKNNEMNWQLVTWSKDQILRLWPIDYNLFVLCGGNVEADTFESPALKFQPDTPDEENNKVLGQFSQLTSSSADTQTSESVTQGGTPDCVREFSHSDRSSFTPPNNMSLKPRGGGTANDTLEQEFRLVNACLPNLTINEMDRQRRTCTVTLQTTTQFLVLNISFPSSYPQNASPTFKFIKISESIKKQDQEKLLLTLRETAQHHVRNNRGCLEPCLRQLTSQFREMSYNMDENEDEADRSFHPLRISRGKSMHWQNLRNVPFPRTSGARFCSAGHLVLFMRPNQLKGYHSYQEKVPRSLAALVNHRRSVPVANYDKTKTEYFSEPQSVASFYYKEKPTRRLRYHSNLTKDSDLLATSIPTMPSRNATNTISASRQSAGKVVIVDMTSILPISKKLASDYIVPEKQNFKTACIHNKEKATSEDMNDLVQLWSCVSCLPHPAEAKKLNQLSPVFQSSPLGRMFLSNLFKHYLKLKDVQTLAMLACTFDQVDEKIPVEQAEYRRHSRNYPSVKRSMSQHNLDFSTSNLNELHKSASESRFPEPQEQPYFFGIFKTSKSPPSESSMSKYLKASSESSLEDERFTDIRSSPIPHEEWLKEFRMVEKEDEAKFHSFMNSYCGFLERWKLNTKVVEIQKHAKSVSTSPAVFYQPSCKVCGESKSCSCLTKRNTTIDCVICQLPVKSLMSFCSKCFHGGHAEHMEAWFKYRKHCPSPFNCPCDCAL